MKKCLLLTVAIILCMSMNAIAEEISIPKDITINANLPEYVSYIDKEKLTLALDEGTTDEVTIEGTKVTVKAEDITYILDVPNNYSCVTQDPWASIDTYTMLELSKDVAEQLKEAKIHMLLLDPSLVEIQVRDFGTDSFSEFVGEMNALSEKNADIVGEKLAELLKCSYTGQYRTESNTYVCLDYDWLMTVVKNRFILVKYGEANMLEEDLDNFHTLVDALRIE